MRYLKYLCNYKLEAILAPLFKLMEAGFELFVPLVVARMIDEGIKGANQNIIFQSGMILLGLALIGIICATIAQYFSAKIASGFGTMLRDDLFSHVVNLSHREVEIVGRDALITRITNDTNQIQTGVNLFFRLVLRSPFIVFGAMIMAFFIDAFQALIFLITIFILYGIVTLISRKTVAHFKYVQAVLDNITGQTLENLTGVRVIRAFNKQSVQKGKFEADAEKLYENQMNVAKFSSVINPLTTIVINLAVVVILRNGAIQVHVGHLTQGQVVALVNYMLQILGELVKMANLINVLSKSFASVSRLDQIFSIQNSQIDGTVDANKYFSKHPVDIEFKNVGFAYPKSKEDAIEQISFKVLEGSFVGVIGGTGSGKTTLINLIPRFFDVTSGEILIGGENIQNFEISSLRNQISLAEQKSRLFKGTIQSNLELAFGKEDATLELNLLNAQRKSHDLKVESVNQIEESSSLEEDSLNLQRKSHTVKENGTKKIKGESDLGVDVNEQMRTAIRMAQASDVLEKKGGETGLSASVSQMGANFSGGQKQRLSLARAMLKKARVLILDDVSSALDFLTDAALRKTLKNEFADKTVFLISQRISSIRHSDIILVMDAGKLVGMGSHDELKQSCEVYREICQSQLEGE